MGKNDVTENITLKNPPTFIELSAGSEGKMQDCFKREEDLSLSASSGSSFGIDNSHEARNREGSSSINLLEMDLSSGSDFEAENEVIIETAKVNISSGASIEIWGVREISSKVSSGGSLRISENTIRIDVTTSSGGEIDVDRY